MERIDLNTKMFAFFERNFFGSIKGRILGTLHDFDCETMWDVCMCRREDLLKRRWLGEITLKGLTDALELYGLRLDMTNDELEAYRCAYESNKGNGPVNKPDTIDWEQRRWELATGFASHRTSYLSFNGHPIRVALTAKEAIKEADEFIKEYKKSLNTEE